MTPTADTNKPQGSTNCVTTEEDWSAWSAWGKGKKKTEDSENPIGPHGFPLYSEKYNPKPFPKYKDSGIANSVLNNNFLNLYWIVDSGVSEHLSGNISFFQNLQKCKSFTISLPNGDKQVVSQKGNITISPSITLNDVYFIPSF